MKPQSPCFRCTDRELACHDKCGKYSEYQITLKAYNDAIKEFKKNEQAGFNDKTKVRDRRWGI